MSTQIYENMSCGNYLGITRYSTGKGKVAYQITIGSGCVSLTEAETIVMCDKLKEALQGP